MAFLDKTGITTLVTKLRDYFQLKLVSGANIKTVNNGSLLGSGNIDTITYAMKNYTFASQTAGASGYFQITWPSALAHDPISVYVYTTSISALNGTQFSVVNATTSGCYITYYCPKAVSSSVSLTIYAYCEP